MNPSPSGAELAAALAARTRFREFVHVGLCRSSQDLATAATGPLPGVFWADHQTAGRGRDGRIWDDEPGVDLTVTFRVPQLRLADPIWLAAGAPAAVCEALESVSGRQLRIRWPNDLLLSGRKLSGILIDALGPPTGTLIGIGVNLNRTRFPAELEHQATSLAGATGRLFDRGATLLELAVGLDRGLTELEAGHCERLQECFRSRTGLLDRPVALTAAGREHRGVVCALGFDRVELDGGRSFPLGAVRRMRSAERA